MSDLTAAQIFNEDLPAKLESNADSVTKVNAVYQFNIDGDNTNIINNNNNNIKRR